MDSLDQEEAINLNRINSSSEEAIYEPVSIEQEGY